MADMELEVMQGGMDKLAAEINEYVDGPLPAKHPDLRLWYAQQQAATRRVSSSSCAS